MPGQTAVARRASQDRTIVLLAAAGLTVAAWLLLALGPDTTGAAGHPLAPGLAAGGPAAFAVASAMWMIMMVAMMLPPVMPWILVFASTQRRATGRRPFAGTGIFVGGYLIVWALFCVVAASGQLVLRQAMPAQFDGGRLGAGIGGGVLIAAGLCQLSDLKAACLRHCRNPLGFILTHWTDGPAGAWRLGATHGLYCLGCCWALMALSFALGIMNLLWMAALTVILCVEKIAPGGARLGRVFGVALLVAGAWLVGGSSMLADLP